jgi:hypothetical protein
MVHSHRKTEKVFSLTTRDVRCVHHGRHGTHRYDIQVLATHASTWVNMVITHTRITWWQKCELQWKATYWEKKFLGCSFYLYRFHKCVSNSFPVINCCNPGVHYETPCITYRKLTVTVCLKIKCLCLHFCVWQSHSTYTTLSSAVSTQNPMGKPTLGNGLMCSVCDLFTHIVLKK